MIPHSFNLSSNLVEILPSTSMQTQPPHRGWLQLHHHHHRSYHSRQNLVSIAPSLPGSFQASSSWSFHLTRTAIPCSFCLSMTAAPETYSLWPPLRCAYLSKLSFLSVKVKVAPPPPTHTLRRSPPHGWRRSSYLMPHCAVFGMPKKACGWQTGTCCRSARAHELGARIVRAAAAAAAHQTRQVRHAASMLQQRKAPSLPLSAMAAHRLLSLPSARPALTSTRHVHLPTPFFTDSTPSRHPRKLPDLPLQPEIYEPGLGLYWGRGCTPDALLSLFQSKSFYALHLYVCNISHPFWVSNLWYSEMVLPRGRGSLWKASVLQSGELQSSPSRLWLLFVSFPSSLTLPHIYV